VLEMPSRQEAANTHTDAELPDIAASTHQSMKEVLCVDYHGDPIEAETLRPMLLKVEGALPELLMEEEKWKGITLAGGESLHRLWRKLADRVVVYLHKIDPSVKGKKVFHFHHWPMAVHVVEGTYRMGVGYGSGLETPLVAMTVDISQGSTYEMLHPDVWHFVEPTAQSSWSVAITGKPWIRPYALDEHNLVETLTEARRQEMFSKFRQLFPKRQ
jgi:hypothetical protein